MEIAQFSETVSKESIVNLAQCLKTQCNAVCERFL